MKKTACKALKTSILAGLAAAMLALSPPAFGGEFPLALSETTLDNGLKVFIVKRPGTGEAACALAVRTGSSAEVPGITGAAHFLEHMMFKGSDRMGVKDPELDKKFRDEIDAVSAKILELEDSGAPKDQIEAAVRQRLELYKKQQDNLVLNPIFGIYGEGGSSNTNAFTSEDSTVYFTVLPSNKIELFFWVESERFSRPVFRQFHAEKDVVREERRLSENRPGHAYREELQRVIFAAHPYAHPVLGYHEDLIRMTRADLREFFDTWYTPDNMFLLVAGDVEEEEVMSLAGKYFGGLKRFEGKRREIPVLPVNKAGFTRVLGAGPGNPSLSLAFRMPPGGSPAELECELAAQCLGDPEGRLRKELVVEKGLATSLDADYDAGRFGGTLWINAELKRGASPLEVEDVILKAVDRLASAPLPQAEISALCRRYRARIIGSLKNEMRIGFMLLRRANVGSPSDIENMLARSKMLSPKDLQAVAAEYLVRANCVTGIYTQEPLAGPLPPPADPDEAAAEEIPGSWKDLAFKEKPVSFPDWSAGPETLGNGAKLVSERDGFDPVFRVEVTFPGGSDSDPAGKEGLAGLLAAAANRSGVKDASRAELRILLEEIVGDIRVEAGEESLVFSMSTFGQYAGEALELLRRFIVDIEIDPAQFLAEKERMKAGVLGEDAGAGAQSNKAFSRLIRPGMPRGRHPTAASVDAIELEDLEGALSRTVYPGRAVIAVSGGFDEAKTLPKVRSLLGAIQPKAYKASAPEVDLKAPVAGVHVMDFDASQGYVVIGNTCPPRADVPGYAAAWMLQTIMGKRIFDRVRSNEGLAYQAGARLSPEWSLPSEFRILFQTKARSVAFGIWLVMDEIRTISEDPPSGEEMDLAWKKLDANLRRSLGRSQDRAASAADVAFHGAAHDWHWRFYTAVRTLSPKDVSAAAAAILDPSRLVIVCVGRKAEMLEGDGIHEAKLQDFGEPMDLAPPKAAGEPVTPEEVVRFVILKMTQSDLDALEPHLSAEFRKKTENPAAKKSLAGQGRLLASAKWELAGTTGEGDQRQVAVLVKMKMGEQEFEVKAVFSLLLEGGKWVLDGIKVSQ